MPATKLRGCASGLRMAPKASTADAPNEPISSGKPELPVA